jgi:hypothetical protein
MTMNTRTVLLPLAILVLATVLNNAAPAALAQAPAVATAGQSYGSVEEAVTALVDALRAGDQKALQSVLGLASARLISSGDKYSDAAELQKFLAAYDERHELISAAPDRKIVQVGKDHWPLPIPLVQANGRWQFDSPAGAQELIDRRIGRNEIAAIRTALAFVDAQKAFFAFTGQNGQAEYAQHLLSSPGKYDGLYWIPGEGEPDSPLEPLVAQAREEGYPIDRGAAGPRPYHGYLFRILTAQGPDTPDGALNYLKNGRMTEGFALIAWPVSYGASGIMSFMVSQDGIVFQKDLGPQTAAIASTVNAFDPDISWAKVEVVD